MPRVQGLWSKDSHQPGRDKGEASLLGIPRCPAALATAWGRQLVPGLWLALPMVPKASIVSVQPAAGPGDRQTTFSWQATWGLAIADKKSQHRPIFSQKQSSPVPLEAALPAGDRQQLGTARGVASSGTSPLCPRCPVNSTPVLPTGTVDPLDSRALEVARVGSTSSLLCLFLLCKARKSQPRAENEYTRKTEART